MPTTTKERKAAPSQFRVPIHGATEIDVEAGSLDLAYASFQSHIIGAVNDLMIVDGAVTGHLDFLDSDLGRMAEEMFLTNDRKPSVNKSVLGATIVY